MQTKTGNEFTGRIENRDNFVHIQTAGSLFFSRNEAGIMRRDISDQKGLGRDMGVARARRKAHSLVLFTPVSKA